MRISTCGQPPRQWLGCVAGLARSLTTNAAVGLVVAACLVAVGGGNACSSVERPRDSDDIRSTAPGTPPGSADGEWFTDRAEEAGLHFVHFNGMSGEFYQPEVMGPGVAMFDLDNDGDLDVYLVQGGTIGAQSSVRRPAGAPPSGRLYRNDLQDRPDGVPLVFTDVTSGSGLDARGHGIGVATGDIDNDGWTDLYLTGVDRNQMFRNNGDGTFTDVSDSTGTGDPASWGVSASFLDYDRDGWLDLFVGNYLSFSLETHIPCFNRSGPPDYCPPEVYRAQPDRLYRNRGDGTFADVTTTAGLAYTFGPALGVATADYNNDGWMDIFVANDQQENQLWINQRDGTFSDMAPLWGAALGASGEAKADMGVDAGDFDNDGDEDLFVTELISQGSTLYVNDGQGLFDERSVQSFIRLASLPYTGFGTSWFDFDNDGWLDLLAVNGQVTQDLEMLGPDNLFPLQQRNLLLRNLGNKRFEDVTDRGGEVFRLLEVSRGAAFGDIDNDGDTDVVVGNDAGPVRLFINNVGNRRHWLGLRLVGEDNLRDMVGARVEVSQGEDKRLWRRARSDGSYASAQDPRVLVGLGESADSPTVRVVWPSGRFEEWTDLPIDRYTTLREGEGAE